MLNQQKMEEICKGLREIYRLKEVRVEYVSSGLQDAVVQAGKEKFAITEKNNGVPIVAFGQPLQSVKLNEHAKWIGITMEGGVLEADYSERCLTGVE